MTAHGNRRPRPRVNGDVDRNGVINFDDYALIDSNFNNQGRPGMNAIPEPATIALMIPLLCFAGARGIAARQRSRAGPAQVTH